jgi:hypothetical protein
MKAIIPARAYAFFIGLSFFVFGSSTGRAQSTNTCISPLNSDFYTKYTVSEGAQYVQSNAVGAVLNGTNAYQFIAEIKLATNLSGSTSVAVVTIPGQQPTLMDKLSDVTFAVTGSTNAFTNLAASFPTGDYQFTIFNNTVTVPLPAGYEPPNGPTLSDYDADQSINPVQDFTLSWLPFEGGGAGDLIDVSLSPETGVGGFSSPAYGCPGQLDGRATSIVIPAGTLTNATIYHTTITFVRVLTIDTNSIPGDALLAGMEALTQTTVATVPITASGPVLTNAALLPGGSVRFDLTTTPGVTYAIQYNQNLNNPSGWTPLLTTDAVATVMSFTNTPASGTKAGFYRAVQQ